MNTADILVWVIVGLILVLVTACSTNDKTTWTKTCYKQNTYPFEKCYEVPNEKK